MYVLMEFQWVEVDQINKSVVSSATQGVTRISHSAPLLVIVIDDPKLDVVKGAGKSLEPTTVRFP